VFITEFDPDYVRIIFGAGQVIEQLYLSVKSLAVRALGPVFWSASCPQRITREAENSSGTA
jgi:hypothetical protein